MDHLLSWWDNVLKISPKYRYFANPTKTWLVVCEGRTLAHSLRSIPQHRCSGHLSGQKVSGCSPGHWLLHQGICGLQMEKWVRKIERLASIASSQPQAAYAALMHGLAARWNYMSHTIPDILDNLLHPVETAIRHKLLPALTGRSAISNLERECFSLPVCFGVVNPSKNAATQHNASTCISAPLIAFIIQQSSSYPRSMKVEHQRESRRSEMTNARSRRIRLLHCGSSF